MATPTPQSFASAQDMTARMDFRTLGQLVLDYPDQAPIDKATVEADPNLDVLLKTASAKVESALIAAGKYEISDLDNLSPRAQFYLVDIVCNLTMAFLFRRRPGQFPESYKQFVDQAHSDLERLRSGENILDLPDKTQPVTPTLEGPNSQEVEDMNLLPHRMNRYFPVPTGSRLPRRQQP